MKKLTLLLGVLALIALPALAADGIVGKNGETAPLSDIPAQPSEGSRDYTVFYNTGGALDTPATTGGSDTGWGPYFIATWVNDTGEDILLVEFGWPCNGTGDQKHWYYWLSETLPGPISTAHASGMYTIADPVYSQPPTVYSYVDVESVGLVVPAGARIYWGYELPTPGLGGQLTYNGVVTWAWYGGTWDPDEAWGRTALLQLKGRSLIISTENSTLSQVKGLFR
jgi:hypothetical protein